VNSILNSVSWSKVGNIVEISQKAFSLSNIHPKRWIVKAPIMEKLGMFTISMATLSRTLRRHFGAFSPPVVVSQRLKTMSERTQSEWSGIANPTKVVWKKKLQGGSTGDEWGRNGKFIHTTQHPTQKSQGFLLRQTRVHESFAELW
jgi:hypothetical protein